MGGAVVIPVITQIYTDFLYPFQTPDRTLTRRNQMLRDDDIFSKVEQKTNKQNGRLLSFLLTFDPDTWQTNTVIFSELNWKIVFSKITSRISKPLSVFDKLGLGSKYRGGGKSVSGSCVSKAWKPPSSRLILIYFKFRSKPSTVICMDPHVPNKLFATKYCFLILEDEFLFLNRFFIFRFFCLLFSVILLLLIFTKTMSLLSLIFFFMKITFIFSCSGMFRDVPACSGMFRNIPCSRFYQRPLSFSIRFFVGNGKPQTAKCHVTTALRSRLQFAVHVWTAGRASSGKWFTARFFCHKKLYSLSFKGMN